MKKAHSPAVALIIKMRRDSNKGSPSSKEKPPMKPESLSEGEQEGDEYGDEGSGSYDPETERCSICMDEFLDALKDEDVKGMVEAMHHFVALTIESMRKRDPGEEGEEEEEEGY